MTYSSCQTYSRIQQRIALDLLDELLDQFPGLAQYITRPDEPALCDAATSQESHRSMEHTGRTCRGSKLAAALRLKRARIFVDSEGCVDDLYAAQMRTQMQQKKVYQSLFDCKKLSADIEGSETYFKKYGYTFGHYCDMWAAALPEAT